MSGLRGWLFNRYLLSLCIAGALLCSGTFLLNMFVDPLWFWQGNQLTGRNFPFNERLSRLNQLLLSPHAYDCLVFGSSRVGLFDHTKIEGYRCFNLSFSSGNVIEFVDYARYLTALGVRPKLVIVGVDDFNFRTEMVEPPATPGFVRRHEPPPGVLATYLSLDALDLSQRTLRQRSDQSRYYDENFVGRILETAPRFVPPRALAPASYNDNFDPRHVERYRQLRDNFPEAAFWGYVPPISAWHVAQARYMTGILDGYLEAISAAAGLFDRFYDFSAPCPMTRRTDNSYDGSHYFPWVNAIIAERLQGAATTAPADGFGLPVHALSRDAYRSAFKSRLRRFLAAEFSDLAAADR